MYYISLNQSNFILSQAERQGDYFILTLNMALLVMSFFKHKMQDITHVYMNHL